jgi:hypothetical protein
LCQARQRLEQCSLLLAVRPVPEKIKIEEEIKTYQNQQRDADEGE